MKLFGGKVADSRPVLYVVEPFNLLLTNWQRARTVGEVAKTDLAMELFAAGHVDPTNPLTALIPSPRPPVKADLLESTPLVLLGERRLLAKERQTLSIVVGLPAETKGLIVDAKAGEAESHGLLALTVGSRSVAAHQAKNLPHTYLGSVLYEPTIQPWSLPTDATVCFLSLLPPELLSYYWTHYFPETAFEAVVAADILGASPTQAEWLLHKANVIGSASLRDRYQILNLFDKRFRCRLFSSSPADKQLSQNYQF